MTLPLILYGRANGWYSCIGETKTYQQRTHRAGCQTKIVSAKKVNGTISCAILTTWISEEDSGIDLINNTLADAGITLPAVVLDTPYAENS